MQNLIKSDKTMEENQNIPSDTNITKVSVDLKQTTSGRWHVGSFKINVDSAGEFNELFDKVYEQVDKKLISLNRGIGINHGVQSNQISLSPDEEKLFMKLRRARMEVALKEGFPPYVVFHDSVLRQIAKQKPDTPESLRIIIGDKKFERYGSLILDSLK